MAERRWLSPRRMLALFLGVMAFLVVGAALVGWSLLQQDWALDEQRIRDRLDSAADIVVAELRSKVTALDQELEALASRPGDGLPVAAGVALENLGLGPADEGTGHEPPPGVVILYVERTGVVAQHPEGRLLYLPTLPARPEAPPGVFVEGERLEYGDEFEEAAASYRRLSRTAEETVRAGGLLRLARVYRKAGRPGEAEQTYDELAALGDTPVEGLPAGLLALGARCALLDEQGRLAELGGDAQRLHDGLMTGAWAIDRATFLLYSEDAGAFLEKAAGEPRNDGATETTLGSDGGSSDDALALAAGAEVMWNAWRAGEYDGTRAQGEGFVTWRGTAEAAIGLVAAPGFVRSQLVESLASLLERQSASLILGGGASRQAPVLRARRTSVETGLPWELQIVSADPIADRARLARRRRLLLSIAALVAVAVIAATYLSSRAVARELEVARLQSEFVSAVSHDFRTPLTSLRQVTDALIGDRVSEARRRDYYDIQRRGIDRLHRLVEGLLDFGRMEAGVREFERAPIVAREWIRSVVDDFHLEVAKQGYTVELSWDEGDQAEGSSVEIEGDAQALARALWNVLDNAVKYSPDCKTICVRCRREAADNVAAATPLRGADGVRHRHRRGSEGAAHVVISVRDRGLGIDPAERQAIFDKFVRGSAANHIPSSGTGLGLAMVRHIVEAHDGDIRIEGSPGGGTTFDIRLPAKQA